MEIHDTRSRGGHAAYPEQHSGLGAPSTPEGTPSASRPLTPRPHAELIILWAYGHAVEACPPTTPEDWCSSPSPSWFPHWKYRVQCYGSLLTSDGECVTMSPIPQPS